MSQFGKQFDTAQRAHDNASPPEPPTMPPGMEQAMSDIEITIATLTGLATVCDDLPDGLGCDAFDLIDSTIAELNCVRRSDYFVPKPRGSADPD